MKKITTEILGAYLPYQLKVRLPEVNKKTCRRYVTGTVCNVYSDASICCHDTVNATPTWFKPILKPIADADTVIRTEFTKFNLGKKFDQEVIALFCFENIASESLQELNLQKLPYECTQWLLAHHYDVFGLIESGDAVVE